jgi:hypothetical protein
MPSGKPTESDMVKIHVQKTPHPPKCTHVRLMLVSPGKVKHHEKTGSTEASSDCWWLLTEKEDTYRDTLQLTDSKLNKKFSFVEDPGHFKRVQIMQ